MKVFFVSDIHLGSGSEPNAALFIHFLEKIKQEGATHLFLVGDIFDLWLADHQYFRERFSGVIAVIEELVTAGIQVHYFEGNHDLYLKHFWQDKLNVIVHSRAEIFQLGPYKVRVEHGDQVDPDDTGYLFLRWFLRTPVLKWIGKNLPGSLLANIGEKASAKSRAYTSEVKTISEEQSIHKLRNHSVKCYSEGEFDFVVSGHIHVVDDYEFELEGKKIRSLNLGTWLKKPVALVLTNSGIAWRELGVAAAENQEC